jgi:micrococcal nuclease
LGQSGQTLRISCVGAAVPDMAKPARVLQVIDGDTIIVDLDGRREHVRLIGIDTPEARPNHRSELQAQQRHVDQKTILQLGNRASNFIRRGSIRSQCSGRVATASLRNPLFPLGKIR